MKDVLKDILVKWGSRKLFVFLSACGLLVGHYIDQEIWLAISIAFLGSNVGSVLMEGYSARTKKAKEAMDSVPDEGKDK